MQVRDLTKCEWVPVHVLLRDVPTVVPLITHRGGKWGVEPALVRCTQEAVLAFPVPREDDE